MKQTIGINEFRQSFTNMGREDNFSYEGLELLFNMLEEQDENMELDVVAICCEYNEQDCESIANDYSISL